MTRLIPAIASALILSVSLPAVAFADQTRSLTLEDRDRYDVPATKGDARAQTALGLRYAGHKTPQSDTTAFGWFKRAAEQGDAEAQLLLSGLLATGRGTEKDYVAAYKWAYLCGLRATEPEIIVQASNMIGVLNRHMTDAEIDRARQQATEWKPAPEIVQTVTTEPAVIQTAPQAAAAPAEPPAPAQATAPAPVKVAHAEPAKVEPAAVAPAVPVADAPAPAAAPADAAPQVVAKAEPQASAAVPGKAVSSKQAERRNAKRAEAKTKPRTRSVRNADYDEMIGTALSYARAYGIHLGGWQY